MITSYDQSVELYRNFCRETLELSTQCLLSAASVNSVAVRLVDSALARHSAALKKINTARDIEDLFDVNATLIRDCVEECIKCGTETAHSLYTEQMQAMQTLYSSGCKFGTLYPSMLRFATTWPHPLIPLWNLMPDIAGQMSKLNPWFRPERGDDSQSRKDVVVKAGLAERKAS
jgi:hypothetical protein